MNQYVERKINEKKIVRGVAINRIAFDAKNQRYVATDTNNVKIISCPDLKCSKFIESEIYSAMSVYVQPYTNNVLICDTLLDYIKVFDENGDPLYKIKNAYENAQPNSVSCNADGSFAVAAISKKVLLYTAEGKRIRSVEQKGILTDVCYLNRRASPSASGVMLLVGNYTTREVTVLSSDGSQYITSFSSEQQPACICVDLNGYIHLSTHEYSIDTGTIRIFEPRMNYALLQNLDCGHVFGICVNDNNEIALTGMFKQSLWFLE